MDGMARTGRRHFRSGHYIEQPKIAIDEGGKMKKAIMIFASLIFVIPVLLGMATVVRAEGQVVVYTTNDQAQNDMMAAQFKKDTGIDCNMVRAGSGVTLKRIRAEKEHPLGDVVLGLSKIIMLSNMDLWEPYKIKDFNAYPAEYKDPNGMWIGQMVHVMVFANNTKLVPDAQAPQGWNDLLDPKWKDRVAYCNPNNSGAAYTQLTIMLKLWGENEAGWKKVEKFLSNAKVTQQSSLVFKGVADGEFPVGVTMEYAAFRYKRGGAPVNVIYPKEGTVAYTEAAAIIKGAPNRKNAEIFLDWASSKKIRELIVTEFMRRPARNDVDYTKILPGMIPYKELKLIPGYDEDYWAGKRDEILEKVKDMLLRIK
jgi:iron(III) transport system substrate-binding protein